MKRLSAWAAAAVFIAAPLLFWIVLNANNGSFSADGPQQLLLYGRLCGILAVLVFFFQLASMGQKRLLDAAFAKSSLVKSHRMLGGCVAALVIVHFTLILAGRKAAFGDFAFGDFLKAPSGIAACIGIAALVAVWLTASLFSRKKLAFLAFRKWHKLVYVGVLGVFAHQLTMGRDFIASPSFKILWCAFLALAFAELAWSKRKVR